jgi:phosphate:Na+ symporter
MDIDIWRPLAGLGLFLVSMSIIESALEAVSGRSFRHFLRRNTANPLRGVASGAGVTAILQSSSLVSLLMLALVGAGVVEMRNALSVIFGANLGTTVTGWVVATIGFKLDLVTLAFPMIAVGGVASKLVSKGALKQYARIVLGIGMLLFGLDLMKGSVSEVDAFFDPESLRYYSAIQFLLFGLVFSAIVQSSSATMMITLSALNGGLIDLPAAAAIAVGADLGTTSTVLIGAIGGSAAEKRVAASHFIFNLVTDFVAFVALLPLLHLVRLIGITDPLLSLVAFHSLFNLIGVSLFLPFLKTLANQLDKLFTTADHSVSQHLAAVSASVPEAATEALELECAHLVQRVIAQNLQVFETPLRIPSGTMPLGSKVGTEAFNMDDFAHAYQRTKALEGEVLAFTLKIQSADLDQTLEDRIDNLQQSVREAVHSSKCLKDVQNDLRSFEASSHTGVNHYYALFREELHTFYQKLLLLRQEDQELGFDNLVDLVVTAREGHEKIHRTIYTDVRRDHLRERDISSLLNANREIYNSNLALIRCLAAYVLNHDLMEAFEAFPRLESRQ